MPDENKGIQCLGQFYKVNTSFFSLLPPILRWVGVCDDDEESEGATLRWTPHSYSKDLESTAEAVPASHIESIRIGSPSPVLIRGRQHLSLSIQLKPDGQNADTDSPRTLVFAARKQDDLVRLYLRLSSLLSASHGRALSPGMVPRHSWDEEFERRAALKQIAELEAADEAFGLKVNVPESGRVCASARVTRLAAWPVPGFRSALPHRGESCQLQRCL